MSTINQLYTYHIQDDNIALWLLLFDTGDIIHCAMEISSNHLTTVLFPTFCRGVAGLAIRSTLSLRGCVGK